MEELNKYFWVIMAIYSIRGIIGFFNYYFIFDKFYNFRNRRTKNVWFGIVFYGVITLIYIPMRNYGPHSLAIIMLILYSVRIIPFLWLKYGKKIDVLLIVLLYVIIVESVAQNFQYIFINKMNIVGYSGIGNDIALVITEVLILCILLVAILFIRIKKTKIYFTELTISEYIIWFLMDSLYALLQAVVYEHSKEGDPIRILSVITFAVLFVLFFQVIIVRDQNISMNSMIGNLKEPMKQITASYIEMNDKNTELRRFRHDTKNHLLALDLLIKDEKYNQATAYIEKLQEVMDTTKEKAFDTGNIIADALIESKAKLSSENGITMTMEGRIPSDNVEDVDLVILISNLLDNAIEAACQVKGEKHIEIQSILKKNIWVFLVKNPCVKDIDIKNNYLKTTKEDKDNHGFGISNIERVIKKYNGKLLLSCENQIFTARATLMDCGSEFDQNEI